MVDSKENYKFDLGVKKLGRLKKVKKYPTMDQLNPNQEWNRTRSGVQVFALLKKKLITIYSLCMTY